MKVEPLRTERATRENLLLSDAVTQQNNWLQNEIVQSSSLRAGSVKSFNPIVIQPLPTKFPNSRMNSSCPPGLEYLKTVDQLLVQQKVELIEAITGFETNNKFNVKNTLGQKVFWAAENNDFCTRNCCGPLRRFKMKVFDEYQNEVMHLRRPAACDSCMFPCCLQTIEVSAPPGRYIGTVAQKWSMCYPHFSIKDANGDTVLRIKGPACTYSICGNDVEFRILDMNGTEIGKISKQWSGLTRELFSDADFFGISFPIDLDVYIKAILLGACFLIDAMFFEKAGNRDC